MKTCSVGDCEGEILARGWCSMHYQRWRSYGDPKASKTATEDMTLEQRLKFGGYNVTDFGCWEWSSSRFRQGYGQMKILGKSCYAHRIAYEAWVGPLPEGSVVRHKCDNPPCINPDHLELGTYQDNSNDMWERGRGADQAGEKNPRSKLTVVQVREIRSRYTGVRGQQRRLAEESGVCFQTINDLVNPRRGRWARV